MKRHFFAVGVLFGLSLAAPAEAQQIKSSELEPCCAITAIDAATALVTARHTSGRNFQFRVGDRALLRTLKIGQAVYAHFDAGKVGVDPVEPCCSIVNPKGAQPVGKPEMAPAQPVGKPALNPAQPVGKQVKPVEPCCSIAAINHVTRVVTAKENATGRVFRFEVKDQALLKTLKLGQGVFADFGSSKVRIHGAEPCCSIIGHGAGKQ